MYLKSSSRRNLKLYWKKENMARRSNKDNCGICKLNKNSSNNKDWIYCNCCKVWHHAICCNLSEEEYIDCKKRSKWFCPDCIKTSNFSLVTAKVMTKKDSSMFDDKDLVNIVEQRLEELWPRLKNMIDTKVKEEIAVATEKLEKKISVIENKLSYQEKLNRNKNVIIQGVPNDGHDEEVIMSIASELNVPNFSLLCVDYVRRMNNGYGSNKPPLILLRFVTLRLRNSFMAAYFEYVRSKSLPLRCINSTYPESSVYINEHLDTRTYKLLMRARFLVRQQCLYKASIAKGKVMVLINKMGPPVLIKTEKDLNAYEKDKNVKCSRRSSISSVGSHHSFVPSNTGKSTPSPESSSFFSSNEATITT